MLCQIRAGGGFVQVGGTVWNILKGDGTEKRGGETKIFKRGGKLGQGVDALKRGSWNPLTNYGHASNNNEVTFRNFLSVIDQTCQCEFEVYPGKFSLGFYKPIRFSKALPVLLPSCLTFLCSYGYFSKDFGWKKVGERVKKLNCA